MTTKKDSTKKGKYQIFVLNGDTTVYDSIINALQDVCGHSYIQAGSCANIIHNTGKCSVFIDTYGECDIVYRELLSYNVQLELQKYKPLLNDKRNKKSNN